MSETHTLRATLNAEPMGVPMSVYELVGHWRNEGVNDAAIAWKLGLHRHTIVEHFGKAGDEHKAKISHQNSVLRRVQPTLKGLHLLHHGGVLTDEIAGIDTRIHPVSLQYFYTKHAPTVYTPKFAPMVRADIYRFIDDEASGEQKLAIKGVARKKGQMLWRGKKVDATLLQTCVELHQKGFYAISSKTTYYKVADVCYYQLANTSATGHDATEWLHKLGLQYG